ncbi:MAG: hypothetical protein RL272_721 [Candidatus Parcubacteria bacterium]
MPRKPRNKRPGRAVDHQKKGRELFEKLCAIFRPFVEPAVRKQCLAEIAGAHMTEEQIQAMLGMLREHLTEHEGLSPKDVEDAIKEAEPRLRDPKTITPEEIDQAVDEAAAEETGMLVAHWLGLLMLSSYTVARMHVLELQPLDDAMMPPLDERLQEFFAESCGRRLLGEEETKDVLRQVRASLPAGQAIPDTAVEILEHEGLAVIK